MKHLIARLSNSVAGRIALAHDYNVPAGKTATPLQFDDKAQADDFAAKLNESITEGNKYFVLSLDPATFPASVEIPAMASNEAGDLAPDADPVG